MGAERLAPLIIAEVRGRYAPRPPLVVDCSVVAAVLFDEPNRDVASQALAGKELFAPDLLADEFASVAVKKSRRGLQELVSPYDAAYLWLAAELGAPLATFDERLGGAARELLGSAR
jgi:predicted nucleic acid-binding protein